MTLVFRELDYALVCGCTENSTLIAFSMTPAPYRRIESPLCQKKVTQQPSPTHHPLISPPQLKQHGNQHSLHYEDTLKRA